MKSLPPIRFAVLVLLALAVAVGGCGKKAKDIPEPAPDLKERDADDFAELLGATIGSNNGGWWFTIEKTCEIIDAQFPIPIPAPGAANALRPTSPFGTFRDTTLIQGNVQYTMEIRYTNLLQQQSTIPDTSTDQIEAEISTAYGGSLANAHVTTTYGFITNLDDTTNFSVINLYPIADTLEFSGTITDSSYALINSKLHPGEARVWYHYDNFFDFTLRIRKASLPVASVVEGEVTWQIAARPMPDYSGNRTVQVEDQLATAYLSFDGTQVARLRITDSFELVEWRYSVDLKTGDVSKLP